jgi:dihydropyrimidinase
MRVDYNLFEGMRVRGVPVGVWVRGRQVVDGDRFLGEAGTGRFLHRQRCGPSRPGAGRPTV